MEANSTDNQKTRRSLKHSVRDGGAYAVMTGAGETYFSAFALFLKASTAQIAFLVSVPPLLASFAQLFSAWLGHKTGKRKAIILVGATLQGFVWLPLALLPLLYPDYAIPLLTACVIFYHAFSNLASPQWASLMGDLVHENQRGRFFALRTKVSNITAFVALFLAGGILHLLDKMNYTATGYVVIFSIAFLARLVSIYHLWQMYDPPGHVAAMEMPLEQDTRQWLKGSQFIRFASFFALMQFSVAFAAPFFSVYLLRDLEFSYFQFTACIAANAIVQFFTLARWGRLSDMFGNRVILITCGFLIPLSPLFWLFSTNFYFLLFTQALSGLAWAGFSLSSGNFLYDLIPARKRATFLAAHNVVANIGLFLGAMLAGYLAQVLPQDFSLLGMEFHLLTSLYHIFLLSFIFRALSLLWFLPKLKEVRRTRPVSMRRLIFRVARFSPLSGFIYEVIGSRKKRH